MKQLHTLLFVFIISLALYCPASASTLAVLPLQDLTQDENGVNFSLTEYLRQKAVLHGFTVLPESEIMAFMVRHRIRSLGVLTSHQLNILQQELKSDFVLLGTVCQLGQKPAAKLSLSLQLTRVADEVVVWSIIKDLHEDDMISLLAISNPESLNDLYEHYFSTLFDTVPAELKRGDAGLPPLVGILTIKFHTDYVKPGEKMEVEVRVYYGGSEIKPPTFNLLITGKEYPVDRDGDARLLKASWLAQEQNGKYPVDLVAVFPSGQRQVLRLGEYTVDGVSPELVVNFFGTTIEDSLYFNRDLYILPRLKVPEQMSKWDIAVFDMDQELLFRQEGAGQIPPRIIWNGMLSGTEMADDGRYMVQVQVWDRADNIASYEGFVNLRRTSPRLKFTVDRKEGAVHVLLDNEIESPMAFWFVKVYEKNGGLVATQVGETLPAALDFTLKNPDIKEPLELIFAGQDMYGNRTWQKVDDLLDIGITKVEKEIVPESQWLENF